MNDVNTPADRAARPYHHGHLREEMLRIAVELAAEGGPSAIALREVARRAGVTPSAAYRHFSGQEDLVAAVRAETLRQLSASMAAAVAAAQALRGQSALESRILAAGRGYFAFATTSQMLFRSLSSGFTLPVEEVGESSDGPFDLLLELVQRWLAVESPVDPAGEPGAGYGEAAFADAVALWSSVHGLSVLCTSGALLDLPRARQQELLETTLAISVRGLSRSPR